MSAPRAAFQGLAASLFRTLLTVATLAVGVATLIVMAAVGRGARDALVSEIARMGTNLILVNAGKKEIVAGRQRQMRIVTTLVKKDAQAILDKIPGVRQVAPLKSGKVKVKYGIQANQAGLVGTWAAYQSIRNASLTSGRFFEALENRGALRVAVLGPTVVENLYPRGLDPVGTTLRIGRVPFEVIGVLEKRGMTGAGTDEDNIVVVPLKTALRRVFNHLHVNTILVQAEREGEMAPIAGQTARLLRQRHRLYGARPDDFTIETQTELLEARKEVSDRFQLVVVGASLLTLLVGGIGILAVMMIGIRRRQAEIGLRRALGATRKDILMQFLLEAGYTTLLGAVVGTLLAVVAGQVIVRFTGIPLSHSPWAILAAELLALFMGLGAAIYPAWRASRTEPAAALRPS